MMGQDVEKGFSNDPYIPLSMTTMKKENNNISLDSPPIEPPSETPSTVLSKIVYVLDTMGENLAWFFGITSPRYDIFIDEAIKYQQWVESGEMDE